MLLLHNKREVHDGDTLEDQRFTLLWLTKQTGGKTWSSLGLGAFLTYYLWAPHWLPGPKIPGFPVFCSAVSWQQFLNFPQCAPLGKALTTGLCFTPLWSFFWIAKICSSPPLGRPQTSPSLYNPTKWIWGTALFAVKHHFSESWDMVVLALAIHIAHFVSKKTKHLW